MAVHAAHEKKTNKHMPLPALIALHLICIGAGLLIFAYFHHVRDYYALSPENTTPVSLITPSPVPTPAAVTTQTASPDETPQPAEAASDRGMFYESFPDKFTDGEIIQTEDSYINDHVNISFRKVEEPSLIYHIAEIYITDIRYLRTAFGTKGYGSRGLTADLAEANDALIAVSGDYFAARQEGVIVRNGVLYRETRFEDVCVLLSDGRMITMSNQELDLNELKEVAPWQVWSFGPALLRDGEPLTEFRSTVSRKNPRSAIGCVEPGHYFFIQVDGRGAGGSRGMTLAELSSLFAQLGCRTAYNLDGGQTAGVAWYGKLISYPYGRAVSDIIYITDHPEGEEG